MRIRLSLLTIYLIGRFASGASQEPPTNVSQNGWAEPSRGIPAISTFDVPPTRHNGEVWAFFPGGAGQLWIGSDELFLFNGGSREKIDLPFETYAVRALAQDQLGKLWIGAIGEIGHLEPTTNGKWHYVSARPELLAAGIDDLRDVWEAQQTPEGIVFVADEQILRWNGSRFERWKLPATPRLLASKDRDSLWIYQSGVGLLRMDTSGPRVVVPESQLPDTPIIWTVSPCPAEQAARGEQLLICAANGVYLRRSGSWTKLERLSAAVFGKVAWRGVLLNDETVAIGTTSGVVIGTTRDEILATIDRSSGLPNESVNSLWFDTTTSNLWVGLVGGMARVEARGATSVFDSHNGLNYMPVQKTVSHNGQTYILSRQSLSVISPGTAGRPATANPIVRLPTYLSDSVSSGQDLWLSGLGGGIWRIVNGREKQEVAATGYIFALSKPRSLPFTLFFLENSHVRALAPNTDGGWTTQDLEADVGAYFLSLAQDGNGDVWVSTVTRGIFCFRPDNSSTKPRLQLVHHYASNQGLPANIKRPILTTLGGRIYVLSEESILGLDLEKNAFVPVPGLTSFAALAGTPAADPTVAYWVVRNVATTSEAASKPALIRLNAGATDAPPVWEPLDAPGLEQAGRINTLSFTSEGAGVLWAAGSQALVRFSIGLLKPQGQPPSIAVRSLTCDGVLIDIPKAADVLTLPPYTKSLRIDLDGVTRAEGNGLLVQTALRGLSDEWSLPRPEASVDFTGLRAGKYTFQARSVDCFGQTGPILKIAFVLAPPWYQTPLMIACYILVGVLVVLAIIWWRVRRLHKLNARLNRLVDERTVELARANTARNEFLESISHEIRNPLNGIANLVDLLRDIQLSPDAERLAQSLVRSAAHLKQVFADVLGYTKLEYGHVALTLSSFSLKLLLEDIIALFAVQAHEQNTELSLILPPDFDDGFRGDSEKIRSIISNFVSNALKYAPGGPVEIEMNCSPVKANDKLIEIWIGVRDHGPGLSQDEQANLFKKFVRGKNAKASGISGTGLGLAICRNLADLLDGKVGVTSTEGKGATFWIKIPLERTTLPVRSAKATGANGPAHTLNKRVLIVDDQEYNQVVLRGISIRLGYEAEVASHDGEVWPLIDQYRFGVVFLDWELPGLNGGEIARRLRGHSNTCNAVVIATTAHDNDEIRQHCLEAGMDGFILKPFDTSNIKRVLDEAAARRAGRATFSNTPAIRDLPSSTPSLQLTLSAFSDFAAGDPARAQQAVSLYLQTLDQEVAALNAFVVHDDREAIARQAHRLRSHAGLVNGTALNIAAQKLVLAARGESSDAWRACIQPVLDESEALKTAIKTLYAESTASG